MAVCIVYRVSLILNRRMQIPFPISISLMQMLGFLGVLLAVQLAEGTDPLFAVLMMAAQVFAVMAFNALGGMSHVAGSYCLFSLLANVTVPEIAHAAVLQPGDFNLPESLKVAAVCAIFYTSFYVAALFATTIPNVRPFLDRVHFSLIELRVLSAIAIIFVVVMQIVASTAGQVRDGSVLAAFNHFYPVLNPLSVILATYVRLKSTGGRSAMDWYTALVLAIATMPGVFSASKEGMLTPLFCWLLVCAANHYRFTRSQVAAIAAVLIFSWFFVYPFSQDARDPVRNATSFSEKASVIVSYINDPSAFASEAENVDPNFDEFGDRTELRIIKRFSLLKSIGMLVSADSSQGFTGIDRHLPAFLDIIPHFIWPNRPAAIGSNELGHKAGFRIWRRDTTTGIAIGSPGAFYDIGGWLALPTYTVLEFGLFFFVLRSVVGTSMRSVWGLMLIGGTALPAGGAFPSTLIETIEQFLMVFGTLIVALKIVSYTMETLFARQIS